MAIEKTSVVHPCKTARRSAKRMDGWKTTVRLRKIKYQPRQVCIELVENEQPASKNCRTNEENQTSAGSNQKNEGGSHLSSSSCVCVCVCVSSSHQLLPKSITLYFASPLSRFVFRKVVRSTPTEYTYYFGHFPSFAPSVLSKQTGKADGFTTAKGSVTVTVSRTHSQSKEKEVPNRQKIAEVPKRKIQLPHVSAGCF